MIEQNTRRRWSGFGPTDRAHISALNATTITRTLGAGDGIKSTFRQRAIRKSIAKQIIRCSRLHTVTDTHVEKIARNSHNASTILTMCASVCLPKMTGIINKIIVTQAAAANVSPTHSWATPNI